MNNNVQPLCDVDILEQDHKYEFVPQTELGRDTCKRMSVPLGESHDANDPQLATNIALTLLGLKTVGCRVTVNGEPAMIIAGAGEVGLGKTS